MSLRAKNILYIILLILFSSCSVNRFIPENKYLLDEVKIESDTKLVDPSQFSTYVRQNPNARWFNLVKVPMRIYCISGRDSTKWINRFFQNHTFSFFNMQLNTLLDQRPLSSLAGVQ